MGSALSTMPVRGIARACASLGLAAMGLGSGGCFTAQLDPDLSGVFACGGDEGEGTCPASLLCVNARCEDPELAPSLTVLDPEDEQSILRAEAIDLGPGQPPPMLVPLEIRIQGSISLVSTREGADHAFGEGHVKVLVDGVEQLDIDEGSIDGSTPVMVQVPSVTGPHRIQLQAYRNDDVVYDNPEATAVRLFWFERVIGERPFVAIKSPRPGAVLDLERQSLDVEIATLNFERLDPGGPPAEGRGHAHLHYDERVRFPACVQDPGCDDGDLGIAGASGIGELDVPSSGAGTGVVTAVLRNGDHTPYVVPFACDPMEGPLDACSPVFDAIDVVRVGPED